MGKEILSYLSRLSEKDRYQGIHKRGEIEIVTDPEVVESIIEKRRQHLMDINLPISSAEVGIVLEDEYILAIRDPVRFPKGNTGTYLRIIERAALDGTVGVVILPFRADKIYLRRVFRHATRSWELECPRGFRSDGYSSIENVEKEIDEELGIGIGSVIPLGLINSNTGLLAGRAEAFWVVLKPGVPNPQPEPQEAFGAIIPLTPKELLDKIRMGEIKDAFTLSALQLAQAHELLHLH